MQPAVLKDHSIPAAPWPSMARSAEGAGDRRSSRRRCIRPARRCNGWPGSCAGGRTGSPRRRTHAGVTQRRTPRRTRPPWASPCARPALARCMRRRRRCCSHQRRSARHRRQRRGCGGLRSGRGDVDRHDGGAVPHEHLPPDHACSCGAAGAATRWRDRQHLGRHRRDEPARHGRLRRFEGGRAFLRPGVGA